MATYTDYTSYISANKSADYVNLGNYNASVPSIPQSSLLKLSVAPSNQRYFSVSPAFEQRLDNFRISQPSSTPVSLTQNDSGYNPNGPGSYAMAGPSSSGGDYSQLGMRSYKMTPY